MENHPVNKYKLHHRSVPITIELGNIVLRNQDLVHLQLRLYRVVPIEIEMENIVIHSTEDTYESL